MKKIFKMVPCILVTAFTLASACACNNGVSDIRSRERRLRERQRQEQQQRLSEREQEEFEDIDPNFSVDPECPHCPDCPDIPEDPDDSSPEDGEEEPQPAPEHGRIPRRRGLKPTPYPLPHN